MLLNPLYTNSETNYTEKRNTLDARKPVYIVYTWVQNRNDIGNVVLGQLRGQPH